MKTLFFAVVVFSLLGCGLDSDAKSTKLYFYCDFLANPYKKTEYPNKYFNKSISFEKLSSGVYKDFFNSDTPKLQGDVLSGYHLRSKGYERGSHYRYFFDVYRMDLKSKTLTHSYLYYLKEDDFKKHFLDHNPHNVNNYVDTRNQKVIFDLVDEELPQGFIKVGWDKSYWQCEAISSTKHFWNSLGSIFKVF